MNIDERLKDCIESNGIIINDDGTFIEIDSIRFISTIVALEEEFDIEIPDEYLILNILSSYENIKNVICDVFNNKDKE